MTWGFPAALWFLALLPAVIALYFLKRRRREFAVSSTVLWRRALQDERVDSPFQRFRRNLLLLLQLLALLALIAALGLPSFETENVPGRIHMILVDASASMGAKESEGTRLDVAKKRARERVEALGVDERAVIVQFGNSAEALTAVTGDRELLQEAIDTIELSNTTTRIDDALRLAESLSRSASAAVVAEHIDVDAVVAIFSDGRFDPYVGDELPFPIDYVRVGEETENVGVVALSAREDFSAPDRLRIFTEVRNSGANDARGVLTLLREGEEIRAAEPGEIAAGARWSRSFEVPIEKGTLEIQWTPETEDALAVDDVARVEIPEPRPVQVAVVAAGSNHFLDAALDPEVLPTIEVRKVGERELRTLDPPADVVIWDRVRPEALAEKTGHLLLGVLPPGLWSDANRIEVPPIVSWDPRHPVNRFVDYRPLSGGIEASFQLSRIPESIPLVETTGGAVISEFEVGGARGVVVGFDPLDSVWPLELSWTFFLFNAIDHLSRASAQEFAGARVGDLVEIPAPTGVASVIRTSPDGEEEGVEIESDGVVRFVADRGIGIERVSFSSAGSEVFEPVRIPINLLSQTESDIAPADGIEISGREVEADVARGIVRKELWQLAAAAFLLLLVIEWWIGSR